MSFFDRPENNRWLPKAPGRRPLSTYDIEKAELARKYMGLETELAKRERSLLDAAAEYWQRSQAEAGATKNTNEAMQETDSGLYGYGRQMQKLGLDQNPSLNPEPTSSAPDDSVSDETPKSPSSAEEKKTGSSSSKPDTPAADPVTTPQSTTETSAQDARAAPSDPAEETARAFHSKQVTL